MAAVRVASVRTSGELRCALRNAGAVATLDTVVLGLS